MRTRPGVPESLTDTDWGNASAAYRLPDADDFIDAEKKRALEARIGESSALTFPIYTSGLRQQLTKRRIKKH